MKTSPWVYIVAVLALFLSGMGIGYRIRVAIDDHAEVKVQKQAVKDADADMKARVRQEQALRLGTESALVLERNKTTALNAQLSEVTIRARALQLSIDHAPLNVTPRPAVAGSCPANPYAGGQYQQLYDSAAEGGVTPSR